MKKLLLLALIGLAFACQKKEEQKPYSYWDGLISEKYEEIRTLTESVPCTDIDGFETVLRGYRYYLVHPSIQADFDRLISELENLQTERSRAGEREGIYSLGRIPYLPVRKICEDGKPKLLVVPNLTLAEIDRSIPRAYDYLQRIYGEVPCTDISDWEIRRLHVGCCAVQVAVHKTIRTDEMLGLSETYHQLLTAKALQEGKTCADIACPKLATGTLRCVDDKPLIE